MDTARQVLVIVGDSEIRELIAELLQPIDVHVILVKDSPAAFTLLNEGLSPAVILLDLMTPTINGFESLERLRKMRQLDEVPVLTIATQADPEIIRRGLDTGADAYVTRSFIRHSLLDRIRVLLAGGRRPRPRTKFYGRTAPLITQELGEIPPETS